MKTIPDLFTMYSMPGLIHSTLIKIRLTHISLYVGRRKTAHQYDKGGLVGALDVLNRILHVFNYHAEGPERYLYKRTIKESL